MRKTAKRNVKSKLKTLLENAKTYLRRPQVYLLAAIAFVVAGTIQQKQDKFPVDRVSSTLVKLSGERGYGSGVIFKSDETGSLILTNKHVCMINDGRAMAMLFGAIQEYNVFKGQQINEGTTFKAQVLDMDANTDLCVLHTTLKNLPIAKFAKNIPKQGTVLFNVSNPLGISGYVASGLVGKDTYIFEMLYRQTTVAVYPGSSGSAVFNINGEVSGLISLGIPGTVISFIVPLEHIRLFINKYL